MLIDRVSQVPQRLVGLAEQRLRARDVVEDSGLVLVVVEPLDQELLRLLVLAPVEHLRDLGVHLPGTGPVGISGLRPDGEDDRAGLARVRGALRPRVADEKNRAVRAVDFLAVDREPGVPRDDDVELLVTGRDLVVLRDDPVVGVPGGPGVDAEGLDTEVLANRGPAGRILDVGDVRGLVALPGHVFSSLGGSASFTFDAYASWRWPSLAAGRAGPRAAPRRRAPA